MLGRRLDSIPGPALATAMFVLYFAFAQYVIRLNDPVNLGAGWTPLVRADRLAAELGLGELWIKNDTLNPTGSFKDRVVSVALTKARELGFKVAACASTGNLANSVAAHAAHAGMQSIVFIPHDLEEAKVVTTAVYGGKLVAVEGNYDDVNRLCAELAGEHPTWAFVNVNIRTYYAEGSKTLAFEVAEQLGWQAPDHVVVPIASGSQLTKVAKGFSELHTVGLLDEEPHVRVSGAQAAGCSPVSAAFKAGESGALGTTDAISPSRCSTKPFFPTGPHRKLSAPGTGRAQCSGAQMRASV